MSLYKENKIKKLKALVGSKIGAQTKLNNYEYGRNKAKKIAESKDVQKKKGFNK